MGKQIRRSGGVYEKSYFINSPSYFLLRTGTFPSTSSYRHINRKTLFKDLLKEYKLKPGSYVTDQFYVPIAGEMTVSMAVMELGEGLMVCLAPGKTEAEVLYNANVAQKALARLEKIILRHSKPVIQEKTVGVITSDAYGNLEIRHFPVKNSIEHIAPYYNDVFLEFDFEVKSRIAVRHGKGIILMHGESGTGKTSYIRHLIAHSATHKNFIYLPSDLSSQLSQPAFLGFLIKHANNSVLILEDTEKLLAPRITNSNSAISTLLNLTDGLLSDVLGVQIIATFNARLPEIDAALLRKGRLISKYHFKALSRDKANGLMAKSGIDCKTETPMTLAEIFGVNERDHTQPKLFNAIGFGQNGNH